MKAEFAKRPKSKNQPLAFDIEAQEGDQASKSASEAPKKPQQALPVFFQSVGKKPAVEHIPGTLSKRFAPQTQHKVDIDKQIVERESEIDRLTKTAQNTSSVSQMAGIFLENSATLQAAENKELHTLVFLDPKDVESAQLLKLLGDSQKIMKEEKDKPIWSAGIVEVNIELQKRLENIDRCENLLHDRLKQEIKERVVGKESVKLIPDEDFIAKGDIWVAPKRIVEKEKRERKKIQKQYTSMFNNRKKNWNHEASQNLKINY